MAVLKKTLFPPLQVEGVWRYKQVSGSVYVRYNEHTKKLVGLVENINGQFVICGLEKLIEQVNAREVKNTR